MKRISWKTLRLVIGGSVTGIVGVALVASLLLVRHNQDIRQRASQLCSSELGLANEYNLFILGDLDQSNTDSQGRVAVGGNANLNNFSIGLEMDPSEGQRDDFIVGGNLSFADGTVVSGNITHGGSANLTNVDIPNGELKQITPINFATTDSQLKDISQDIKQYIINGEVTDESGTLVFTGDEAVNVFSVNGTQLANATGLDFNVTDNSTIYINVSGKTINLSNFEMFLKTTGANRVLFNFYEATKIDITAINVRGSVLAPYAAVTFNNAVINGTLVAQSLTGDGQSNLDYFNGCEPKSKPSPFPSPSPLVSPSPSPVGQPSPSPEVTPTPGVTPSPAPTPSATPGVTPSPTPTPSPSIGGPEPIPTPSPISQTTPSPTPSATPDTDLCNETCSSDSQCSQYNGNLICHSGRCRHKDNINDTGCNNPTSYSCDSDCSSDEQCKSISSDYACIQGNCRLIAHPDDQRCNPAIGGFGQSTEEVTSETNPTGVGGASGENTTAVGTVEEVDLPAAGVLDNTIWLSAGGLVILLAGMLLFL